MYEKARMKQIAIYGAGMVGVSVYYALKALYPYCRVVSFIVSRQEGNPVEIDGIPVIALADFTATDVTILVAVPENYHPEIVAALKKVQLQKAQFQDIICIDSKAEAALMERYYEEYYKENRTFRTLRSFDCGIDKAEIAVFASCFYKDKPLKKSYKLPEWVKPIQSGAVLTDMKIAECRDDSGENISRKNVNYSELSAMYWIGKHAHSEYLGLFHYRRILNVSEEDLFRLGKNDIDVILPYPTIHYPNCFEHPRRYLTEADWRAMLQALKECAPDYAEALSDIFSGQYFYNYNMLIAKEQVFQDYCGWLFPILQRTEELSVPRGWERSDRYIGYMGESLTTLYFMKNRDKLKIAHTGRLMLI